MKNKIALVTGASKGIGKAIVERLVNENYFVLAIDIDKENGERLQNEMGNDKIRFISVDICDENKTTELFKTISSEYGQLDVLVNNAGIIKDNMIWKMPVEDFDAVINVNLKGTWLMCREAAKMMKNQNSGRIVNIASRAWLGNRGQSNYSASKAGVIGLTRVLALELGKYNVCVNAVAPGLIDTPLSQKLEKDVLQKLIDAQPTRTMGKPEDVANAVAFLASEKTQFITGQTIYVDGGKSIGAGN
ncbi:MAG: SDR family NAD(P)-dependent oxidoreductase [Bacteroidetes bacterium]|jgi:NAD(P)-dependent dehydrogenase (short-subunit alcohol dehydrogenase family)|nr:SDR family NAD(P)-dependent oxidoreductase [Bacteroidota bacterium]